MSTNAIAATEYYIRSILKGSVALAAYTTTAERLPLPRGTALPAVGYTLIHTERVNTLPGVTVYTKLDYRISAIAIEQTILQVAAMAAIIDSLFTNQNSARIGVSTPYGTIMACYAIRDHSLDYQDPVDSRLTRYMGTTYRFEVN